jgi:hypothetical protein
MFENVLACIQIATICPQTLRKELLASFLIGS